MGGIRLPDYIADEIKEHISESMSYFERNDNGPDRRICLLCYRYTNEGPSEHKRIDHGPDCRGQVWLRFLDGDAIVR